MTLSPDPLSPKNQRIKRLRRLVSQRNARSEEGVFVVEGPTLVNEALSSARTVVIEVFADASLDVTQLAADCQTAGAEFSMVTPSGLDAVLSTISPQPVAAIVKTPSWSLADLPVDRPMLIVVDGQDPGNVGTLCRTAEAAGFGGLVLAGDSVDATNPKVVRAAAGASLRLPIVTRTDPLGLFGELQSAGRSVLATTVGTAGTAHDEADLTTAAVVLGNEARGLSVEVVAAADQQITIALDGPTESLNVAAAGAVLCFESLRQRRALAPIAEQNQRPDAHAR